MWIVEISSTKFVLHILQYSEDFDIFVLLCLKWYIKGVSYTRNEDDYNHSLTAIKHVFTTNFQSSSPCHRISSRDSYAISPVKDQMATGLLWKCRPREECNQLECKIGPTRMEQGYLPVFDPREEENCIANAVQVIKRRNTVWNYMDKYLPVFFPKHLMISHFCGHKDCLK
ncbi:uncharacterized protein LOC124327755 [Daphnia pulicaria]|uniref:uncharacterized protein LOC124327755 n=1 Tax=Daphnia pulicaria TaxID=35523 RepID=UPI001EEC1B94|nr:uncharacterized protein LOC124327755 [Daphnia pulicaria]